MIIAFGCDHASFPAKESVLGALKAKGHTIIDCGCFSADSVDYPDYAQAVCRAIMKGECEKGVLLCGSGIGMSIAANKFRGIRAALCYNDEVAALASKHNDANVLCAGTRFFTTDQINRWIKIWMETPFEGSRHTKRINKIKALDKGC